ncbi:MAG: hypothetical protein AB1695_14205 [Stygiobacter sp.]
MQLKNDLDIKAKGFDFPKKELKEVKTPEKVTPNTELNFFEKIKAIIFIKKEEEKIKMLDAIRKIIVTKLVQWILKAGGGVLAGLGISQNSVEEITIGAVTFLISALWSLISTGKIALTPPEDFLKLK